MEKKYCQVFESKWLYKLQEDTQFVRKCLIKTKGLVSILNVKQ